ncbi:MAG: transcriptional regulator [Rhodobacteraceae bacterium]|nr:transcriptional regulator [Paracoccaceae bacterium]
MRNGDNKSKLQERIDENLKRVYQEALDERLPDRFQDLLQQLREKEAGK